MHILFFDCRRHQSTHPFLMFNCHPWKAVTFDMDQRDGADAIEDRGAAAQQKQKQQYDNKHNSLKVLFYIANFSLFFCHFCRRVIQLAAVSC